MPIDVLIQIQIELLKYMLILIHYHYCNDSVINRQRHKRMIASKIYNVIKE